MKKIKIFGLASTMILAGAAGFTSCSSDSADPIGGGTGVAGQVVKTQFAINIPYGGNGSSSNLSHKSTRMTDAITQQNKNFRGISDIVLLTFSGDPATGTTTTNAAKPIYIGTDGNAYDKDEHCRLYRDIVIPTGTDHMIFYGKATKNGENEFQAGKITEIGNKKTVIDLNTISHKLTPINSTVDFTTDNDARTIIQALNSIANAKVTEGSTTYTWANIGSVTALPEWLTVQEQDFLKKRYNAFIKLQAGSKNSVKAFIESLQLALAGETTGATVPDGKKLTKEIDKQCKAALNAISSLNFPGNLPDGAATLSWNSGESTFAYNVPNTSTFITDNAIDYQKICYPAELSYFVTTKTMVSDHDMSQVSDFPKYDDWTKNTDAGWTAKTNFKEGAVTNTTKTVGLKDPVQYSVAVLKSTVKCEATLDDNAKALGGHKEDQSITVSENSFQVTGILIGGQPASVDWKYEPKATGESFANTIYDNVMNGAPMYAKHETTVSNSNYTLVFDNQNATNKKVYVTIELENNSNVDFYGTDGVVPKGAKFYLVGELDPAKTGLTLPTGVDRVFVQDHITTANFTIKDLKKAYNCIPDLRTSGINVGLAVDLKWEEGITFDVDL